MSNSEQQNTPQIASHIADEEPPRATMREWIGLAVLALACVLYVMDLTVLHLAVPKLSKALKPSSAQLLWIIDVYGFMVAGFLVTMGSLGDRIGRRKLLMIGSVIFGAVSVLAAFSTSAEMLIFNRALLGVAGATLAPSTLSLIFNMFQNPKERSIAIAVWISAFSAGSGIGPVLGGIVLEYFWWGSVFLLALPVMALLLILGPFVLPEYRDPKAGRIDLFSVALSLLSILPIIYCVKQIAQDGLNPQPLLDALPHFPAVFLAPLGVFLIPLIFLAGLFFGFLFARRQLIIDDPVIDLALFRIPAFSASLVVNVLAVFIAFGYFLFVAQYLQLVLNLSPMSAGLWSVPPAVAFIVGSNITPRIAHRIKPAYVISIALAISAVGLAILTHVGGDFGLATVVAASVIISLGLAPVFGLTTELIVGAAPPESSGAASGMAETASELGGALGISVLGSIGAALYRGAFAGNPTPGLSPQSAAIARDTLGAAVDLASKLPSHVGVPLLKLSRDAFVQGIQMTALLCAVIAAVAAMMSFTMLRDVKRASH